MNWEGLQFIAHRGAPGRLPENTLAAVELAHRQGADWIECDVVLTKDDALLVSHDLTLEMVTDVAVKYPGRAREDGRYYVLDFTLPEIRVLRSRPRLNHILDAELYPDRFPVPPEPQPLPTLEEYARTIEKLNCESGRDVGLCVELKGPSYHERAGRDLIGKAVATLGRLGYNQPDARCMVLSFEPAVLRKMRTDLGWLAPLMQLLGPIEWMEGDDDYERLLTAPGLRGISGYAECIGAHLSQVMVLEDNQPPQPTGLVERAHEMGLQVAAYTFAPEGLPLGLSLPTLLDYAYGPLQLDMPITDFPDYAAAARQRAEASN